MGLTGTSNRRIDKLYQAKQAGKRISANKKVYYEYRANRADVSKKTKL